MTLEKYFKITTTKAHNNKNNANNGIIKQTNICKEELDLSWEEELCDGRENEFNMVENLSIVQHKEKNALYNATVVIQRLPEQIVKKYLLNKQKTNVRQNYPKTDKNSTANLCTRFCENCKKTVKCNLKTTTGCPKCKTALVYECKKCKKHSKAYTGILYHLRTSCQTQGYYYQCPGCPYKSALKNRIKEHMEKLHKNLSISDMRVIATQDLQNDVKNSEIHIYKCSKCGKQFRQLHFLNNHSKSCGDFKYRIGFAGENKDSNSKDGSHAPIPAPDTLNVLKLAVLYCEKCDKRIALNDTVYSTKKCNDCESALLFKCTKCEKQYQSGKGIVYHFQVKCAAQEMYFCSKCNYKNPVKRLLTIHYQSVHESNSVECPKCKSTLKNKGSLAKHLEYCGKEAYLHCDKCSYKTNSPTLLRVHVKRHDFNDNKSKASCPKCRKKFKNKFSLRCHLNYCGKERGFHCTLCTYKSTYKRGLRSHMIRMHFKDVNKYPACPKCGAKFNYKHCANAHLRFCGTSKPHFQCDDCPFKCGKKDEIRSHIIRLHLQNIENSDHSDVDVVN